MVIDYQERSSTHVPPSAGIGFFSQPLHFDRYMGEERGRLQHQHFQGYQHGLSSHPHLHPHALSSAQPHDLHEAIYREIEKERIRQEIIMSEILRKRTLEAEVRREMMMEMALGGTNVFSFGSPSPMGLDLHRRLPLVETRSSEERIMMSLSQRNNLNNRRESELSVPLPFQRASDDVRVARNSEVKSISKGVREKQKIILQGKPIQNTTGAKRARSGWDASESQSDGHQKKVKKEMRCALCQVWATNERGLNEHLEGKKHKMKEAELRDQKARKNYSIGLRTKKVAKPIQGSGTVDPGTHSEMKFASEALPFSKSGDIASSATDDLPTSQEILTSENLKKESVVRKKVEKKDKVEKKNYKFWCEMCQIGVDNPKVMDSHTMGRKHRRQLDMRNKCSGLSPSQKDRAVEKTMAEDIMSGLLRSP